MDAAQLAALASLVQGQTPGLAAPSDPAATLSSLVVIEALAGLAGLGGLGGLGALSGLLGALGAAGAGATAPAEGRVAGPVGVVRSRGPRQRPVGGLNNSGQAAAQGALPTLTSEEASEPNAFIDAANRRDERRCRALLAHKDFLGINQKDAQERSVLHVAILKKLPEDLCIAILNHPDFREVNAVDQFGYTCLALAASNAMGGLCLAILESPNFLEVNKKDKWGATALHWAASTNLPTVCTALLEHPAFVEAHVTAFSFKFENQTALQVAQERGCAEAAEAIKTILHAPLTA